jgi:predicted cobalt transporter CbtA
MVQSLLHYSLHFIAPIFIALLFFRRNWVQVYFILLATMLVDLDHLFATPIFDPNRCSVGFHILHTYYAIAVYIVLLFFRKTRVVAIGLLFHMLTDYLDCFWIG